MNFKLKTSKAFTIIEMLVVVGIVGLILPLFYGIVFTLLKQQVQILQLQRLKQAGDFATSQIQRTVRTSALEIDSLACENDTSLQVEVGDLDENQKISFSDINENCFVYYVKDNELASMSAILDNPVNFIDSSDSDMEIKVINAEFTKENNRVARLKFTITNTPLTDFLKPQSLSYQFFVFLRN